MRIKITHKVVANYKQQNVVEYQLIAENGFQVNFLNYGGIITAIYTPDKENKLANVVVIHNSFNPDNPGYMGAITGRTAGRIANGLFRLGTQNYQLPQNNGNSCLHGGPNGLDKQFWNISLLENGAKLSYLSPAGENGYPANILFEVYYLITSSNRFVIKYMAYPDEPTIINLTNHTYFDLSAGLAPMEQELQLPAESFAEVDNSGVPTGILSSVTNTPFDFNHGNIISKGLSQSHPQLEVTNGYDHPFLLNNQKPIKLIDHLSGRFLEITTDEPVCVVYSANYLIEGRKGICLETQKMPNAINLPEFEKSVIFNPEKPYNFSSLWQFGVYDE